MILCINYKFKKMLLIFKMVESLPEKLASELDHKLKLFNYIFSFVYITYIFTKIIYFSVIICDYNIGWKFSNIYI